MTDLIILGVCIVILLFGAVVLFGAPYLPTLRHQAEVAFDLLKLKPGERLLELGSGDGRILKAAAERGIAGIGIEINPLLVVWSKIILIRYRELVTVRWGNFWSKPLPEADAIFVFLDKRFMAKLDNKIIQDAKEPLLVVSFAFPIPNKKPVAEKDGVYLYKYN